MALPNIMRRLFRNDGYGPLLRDDIISKSITIRDYDNTVDYPVGSIVLYNNQHYYAFVENGPGTTAGVKTPANAFATHWMLVRSHKAIYVAGDGDDNSDGLTRATAVRTISKALSLCNAISPANFGRDAVICLYGGTYTESGNIVVSGTRLEIELYESATINVPVIAGYGGGMIAIADWSGNNATLTINGRLYFEDSSIFYSDVLLTINNSANVPALNFFSGSVFHALKDVNVSSPNSGSATIHNSFVYSTAALTFSALDGFITNGGHIDANAITITHTGSNSNSAIYSINCSSWLVTNLVAQGSFANTAGIMNFGGGSSALITSLTLRLTSGSASNALFLNGIGRLYIDSAYSVSGSYSDVVTRIMENSSLTVPANVTITNNASGKRHYVDRGGQLHLNGVSNPNKRLPGSTDGSAHAASFGFVL